MVEDKKGKLSIEFSSDRAVVRLEDFPECTAEADTVQCAFRGFIEKMQQRLHMLHVVSRDSSREVGLCSEHEKLLGILKLLFRDYKFM